MPFITVGQENSGDINLFYEDHGMGTPVVLIHGFPFSGRSWERQVPVLLEAGHRVIAYDRRGFGHSSQPISGYDYDTFAADLHELITQLDLHKAVLVGMSMGGGEVAHYLGKYGSKHVSKAVFLDAVPPFLLKTADNPEGLDKRVFDEIVAAIKEDRLASLTTFVANFFNTDVLLGKRVSEEVVRDSWNIASHASPAGTLACVPSWLTDFRNDLARIDVPTLVIHGDQDRICPINATGIRINKAIKGSQLVVIEGGPHGSLWTHAEQVNQALTDFLGQSAQARAA